MIPQMIPTKLKSFKRPVVVVAFLFCMAGIARAHDPGLSAVNVRLNSARVDVHLSIARSDVENAIRLNSHSNIADDTEAPKQLMEAFGQDALALTVDDQPLTRRSVEIHPEESGAVGFEIAYDLHPGSRLKILSRMFTLLPRGHRQYVSVVDAQRNKLGEKVLNVTDCELEMELSSTLRSNTILQFVALGIEHILTGYDHLVFLFGLLIAGAGVKDIAKIITSFTAAHSITLALSTLDLVHISPSIVEPMIAVSIIYVGLENIFSRDLKWRWILTFGFGTIHGFGFASALRELGIGSGSSAALSLISFNAGVEVGQLSVAAVILPIVWSLKKRQFFAARLASACSLMISVAGAIWLVNRLLG